MRVRPFAAGDEDALLELAEADRLPGQPEARHTMLADALPHAHDVDVDVAVDPAGRVRGVISYARPSNNTGLLSWLHAQEEDREVIETLVRHALHQIGPRPVRAFAAGPFAAGLQGLPVRRRPETRRVLEAIGFTEDSLRRYLHRHIGTLRPTAYPLAIVEDVDSPPGWKLLLRDRSAARTGGALISRPVHGTAVLQHLDTDPADPRGAVNLVHQCVERAAAAGATDVAVYLDDAAAGTDTTARLLEDCGFADTDRLSTLIRRP